VARRKGIFYAVSNYKNRGIRDAKGATADLPVVDFIDGNKPVEIKIGLFVSSAPKTLRRISKRSLGTRASRRLRLRRRRAGKASYLRFRFRAEPSGRRNSSTLASIGRSLAGAEKRYKWRKPDAKGAVVKADFQYYTAALPMGRLPNKLVLLA